uniref:Uncharacterized protein n=1 Tax=Quercus lobata TaxID=97700 RepID=A0A7N2LSX8_QUELO
MTRTNQTGNTILHEAATLDHAYSVNIAREMLYRARGLLSMCNELGETALFRAARYDLDLEIATRFRYLVRERDEDGMTVLQLLSCGYLSYGVACNPKAFERVRRRGFLKRISGKEKKDTSWEVTSSGIDTSKLTLHKYGSTSNESNPLQQQVPVGEITPLFLATKPGCIEIVKEILKIFPQAVEHIDNEGQIILHVAIKYRQLEVFDLVLKMEVAMR